MTIINFDDIIGKKFNTITNNVFCLSHPKNALIIGKTNILNYFLKFKHFNEFNSTKFYI